jgi:lysophospholipase L1-like esterase
MANGSETTDADVLTAAQEDELLRGAPWHRLAVVGDSLAEAALADPVDGYERLSWPERVARALRRQQADLELLNVARRDLTSAQVADSQLGPALEFRPDLAFVLCGGNDVLGRQFDPEQSRATIDGILTAFTSADCDVLLITTFDTGPLPVPEPFKSRLTERMPVLHELYRELGAGRPRITLADLTKSPRGRDRGIFSADGMHTNDAGQAVIAALVVTALTHAIP